MFLLTSVEGNGRYQLLPRLVKSCLVLAQANADSERSLSVNARVVTKKRSRLGEQTIVGLWLLKDAVKFHDPVNCRPEIPVTKEMRKSVHLAHSAYKARLAQEKEEKKKELEETKRKKEEEERLKIEKEKLLKSRDSLAKNEADILKDEKKAREDLEAADKLLSDVTSKLDDALSASTVNRQSVSVATMVLDTARNKREQAVQQLKAGGEKRKSLDTKTHKFLQKAIPSAQPPAKI